MYFRFWGKCVEHGFGLWDSAARHWLNYSAVNTAVYIAGLGAVCYCGVAASLFLEIEIAYIYLFIFYCTLGSGVHVQIMQDCCIGTYMAMWFAASITPSPTSGISPLVIPP